MATTEIHDPYLVEGRIGRCSTHSVHREDEYDSAGFATLRAMQDRHFWYRGRHRFLLAALRRQLRRDGLASLGSKRVIDMGGGCGGWLRYLVASLGEPPAELALGDSSARALEFAADELPASVGLYEIDLLDLRWRERWDVVFLLDVLEHIPDDEEALRQIRASLAPGGLLFVTTPALQSFWSWNDDLAHHQRRYSKQDYRRLANSCGFELLDARYFMFLLSPLLLGSRWCRGVDVDELDAEARQDLLARTHRVPHVVVNAVLTTLFASETPLGHWLPFPWGTSILCVLRKSTAFSL